MATTASTSGEKAGTKKAEELNETPAQKVQREKHEAAVKAASGK